MIACICSFSDGYADQFGGEKGMKLMSKSFKRLLLENSRLPMPEQKNVLEKSLDKWMRYNDTETGKAYEQIDDITVLGIRI